MRTAAAGAIAAKYLAKAKLSTVGVVGAGAQGRFQIMALPRVRDFDRVLVHDVNPSRLEQYVEEMPDIVEVTCQAGQNLRDLVSESEVPITATPATEPHLRAEWLHPGLHIMAMGADSPDKQELENAVLGRADLLVCDLKVQCFERGELHHALEDGTINEEHEIVELGELTSGRHPGRTNNSRVTVCDLTGVGVQDAAIATLAYEKTASERSWLPARIVTFQPPRVEPRKSLTPSWAHDSRTSSAECHPLCER